LGKGTYLGGSTIVHLSDTGGKRGRASSASLRNAAQQGLKAQDRLIAASARKAADYQKQLKRANIEEQRILKRREALARRSVPSG